MKRTDEKINKTVIILDYACNNNCIFCINANKRSLEAKSLSEVKRLIVWARERGSDYLELIGGEPTIRPDILKIISFARQLKFNSIVMATNGRRLSYQDFASRLIEAGLTNLIFSIHGHTEELHDSLTQSPGSFKQLLAGLENVKKLGLKGLGANTAIVKANYQHLPEIGRLIIDSGIRNSEFIFVDPTYGAAYDNFFALVPKISKAAPFIRRCLDLGKGGGFSHWAVRYVPLCFFQEYDGQISEQDEVFETKHLAPDFVNMDVENSRKDIARIKPEKCRGCKAFQRCEGIWKEYIKHYGDSELSPIL